MTENEVFEHIGDLSGDYKCFDEKISHQESLILCNLIEEVQQYRAIGTIEEFKALKEKNVAKKPRFYAHNYYCTECGNLVGNNEFKWQRFLYCDKCGQKLVADMQTAYNVEKVVAELEEAKEKIAREDYCRTKHYIENDCEHRDCFKCCAEYLIDIVRKGGVE